MSGPGGSDIFNGYGGEAGASQGGLLDLDLLADLFGFHLLDLGDGDGQDAVFDLGSDVFAVRVLREEHRLLELGVGEFAAEIVALVLLLLVLDLLFHVPC